MNEVNAANPTIGRVLRASTTGFTVGCRVNQLDVPAFGGLIRADTADGDEAIYGLIANMAIDDDPLVRRLVLAENPPPEAIGDQRRNRLLPIEMTVLALGYGRAGRITHGLPPRPPLNLDPVVMVTAPDEVRRFTDALGYLRLVLSHAGGGVPIDQLLVAHILDVTRLRGDDHTWAARAIQELVRLLRGDYELLVPTVEALSEALPGLAP